MPPPWPWLLIRRRSLSKESFVQALRNVPMLGKLLVGLARDPRVPRRNKLIFGAIAIYLVAPIDIIPDFIPGIGRIDDIILVALALDGMLNKVPQEVLKEHWEGEEDVLDMIQTLLGVATDLVPDRIKDKMFPPTTVP